MYNFKKVFKVFREHYKLVPLEVFGKDPYKTLISTILSARTRDETTLKVAQRLFSDAPTVRKLDELSEQEITRLIHGVGFYKVKAKYLKSTAKQIIEKFGGKVPGTKKQLVSLPGVGTKTANLVLNRAFDTPAIAVDTHVHRISNLLGWVNTKTPEQTETSLEKILPREYWCEINRLFVSIGQQYRTKVKLEEFLQINGLIKKKV